MAQPLDDAALDTLFRTARSYTGYDATPVDADTARRIYDLVKMAPTSANQQPARFVWCTTDAAKERLAACMSDKNADKVRAAPLSVVIGMDLEFHEQLPWLFPHADARSWFAGSADVRYEQAFRNSSLQAAYLILAVRALGLDTGPMSGFDAGAVDRAFFAEQPNVRVNLVCTIGHGDPATVFARSPRPDFETFNTIA